jgi:hypothetical protein
MTHDLNDEPSTYAEHDSTITNFPRLANIYLEVEQFDIDILRPWFCLGEDDDAE